MVAPPLPAVRANARTGGLDGQPTRRVVDIADVPVLLEADDPGRWFSVTTLLAGLTESDRPPRAAIRHVRAAPPLPAREPDRTYDDLRVWRDGTELVLQFASDARARIGEEEARIGGGSDHVDAAFARLFHFAITHLLAPHGRFVVHAAAVAGTTGAFLVLGGTGTGKSTLALAALGAGWQVLGDDLAVVRLGHAGGVELAGVHRRTAVPGDLAPGRATGGRPLAGDHRNRWELPPERLATGWFPLAATLLVGHSQTAEGEVGPWHAQAVFDTALASFTATTDPARLRRFLPVAAALSRLPAWTLELGADAGRRLAGAACLLDRIDVP